MFDISAFFGEPKPNEQTSDVIVDPRKHLKTVKMINTPNKEAKCKLVLLHLMKTN